MFLEIKSVGLSFSGVPALKNVSFSIAKGELHALMGENGAGKSTLMKIISGAYTAYDGALLLNGQTLKLTGPSDAQKHGIAIVHQELSLVPGLSIAENIFLGHEPRTKLGLIDRKAMHSQTQSLLSRFQLNRHPADPVTELRVGEQQIVEVAKAVSRGASLLILDEPTSALSDTEIRHLFTVINTLKSQGVTIIYISHKLEEIFELADNITVLRDGQYIGTRLASETTAAQLIGLMVGRPLDDLFPKIETEVGRELLEVENVGLSSDSQRGRSLSGVTFCLRSGEIVGVAGLMGSGRTELLETLFGVPDRSRVSGTITVDGTKCRFSSPSDAMTAGLAFVTEDRKQLSLVMTFTVCLNMTLAALRKFTKVGLVNRRLEWSAGKEYIQKLLIKTSGPDASVSSLSGGNQQKVVLAKWLLNEPKILLLDEPTRGIDVGAKAEIYALISQLAGSGAGILMCSSEMPELLAMCDRILVLSSGRLSAEFSRTEATQEKILEAAAA